jgi:hypothetical protein
MHPLGAGSTIKEFRLGSFKAKIIIKPEKSEKLPPTKSIQVSDAITSEMCKEISLFKGSNF